MGKSERRGGSREGEESMEGGREGDTQELDYGTRKQKK